MRALQTAHNAQSTNMVMKDIINSGTHDSTQLGLYQHHLYNTGIISGLDTSEVFRTWKEKEKQLYVSDHKTCSTEIKRTSVTVLGVHMKDI